MRVAVVDLGTNSTRLLVADVGAGEVKELERRTDVTRLGEGVDATGRLADSAVGRVLRALDGYAEVIAQHGAERRVAVATSAVRDAANGPAFREALAERYGIDARTISGEAEARLTFLGATTARRPAASLFTSPAIGGQTEHSSRRGGTGDAAGEAGAGGDAGAGGEAGTRGEPGARGEAGTRGDAGAGGEPGARGEAGVRGEPGAAARHIPTLVIDIGGGSTEYVVGRPGEEPSFHVSTQAGSVRQTERHIASDPPAPAEVEAIAEEIRATVESAVPSELRGATAAGIAVAGTPTSLAAIDQALDPYDPERVHGYTLRIEACERMLRMLACLPLEPRRGVTGLHPGRAPTIVAGAVILLESMRAFGLQAVETSEADILHGAALAVAAGRWPPA